jgi:hypothetical protein
LTEGVWKNVRKSLVSTIHPSPIRLIGSEGKCIMPVVNHSAKVKQIFEFSKFYFKVGADGVEPPETKAT